MSLAAAAAIAACSCRFVVACAIAGRGEGPKAGGDFFQAGFVAFWSGFKGFAHHAQVLRHGSAAATDDFCAAVAGEHGIICHERRSPIIMDVTIDVFGDACVAFGDDRPLRALGGKALHGAQHIRGTDAAIGTEGEWLVIKFFKYRLYISIGSLVSSLSLIIVFYNEQVK